MRAHPCYYHVALVLLAFAGLSAQSGPSFEVVSVKPTQPGSRGGAGPFVNTEPGRLSARGTLLFFVEYAYGVNGIYVEAARTGSGRIALTSKAGNWRPLSRSRR